MSFVPRLATDKQCTGCFACIDVCNKNAINIVEHYDGHRYVEIDKSKCVGCGMCEQICPIVSNFEYQKSEYSDFYAAWAKNRTHRKTSASGGAFYAMAFSVIEQGGIVFGAKIESPCYVHHQAIDTKEELTCLQGSKYTHSNASGNYKLALKYLKEGRMVLFSGTGCQIAGLLSFLKDRTYKGSLVTVDLICGGIPSKILIDKFISQAPYKVKRVLSFRTKETGWKPRGFRYNLKVEDENGKIYDYANKNNLITTGFSLELTNRYSCYDCPFVGKNRKSDFTIGDYWGCIKYDEEHFDGISLIIAHTDKARQFLSSLKDSLFYDKADMNLAISHNHRLVTGHSIQQYFFERKLLAFFSSHLSDSVFSKVYAYTFSNKSPWILLKVIRKAYGIVVVIIDRIGHKQ